MAVGFTPRHQETYSPTIAPSYWLALASMAVEQLGWTITHLSDLGLMAYTNQGMFKFNAEITIRIGDQLELQSASTGSEMFDWGKNKKMVQQLIAQMDALQQTPEETLAERQAHLSSYFSAPEEDIMKLPPSTWVDDVKGFLQLFVPRSGYFVTPVLIDLNILLFVLMAATGVSIMDPTTKDLLRWGANLRTVTLSGEWWRLLSCCFIHIGIMHLLMNMYALMYIGLMLEPRLGWLRYLTAYLLTGVAASVTSLWWHDNVVSAGASGAIFGLYGVFLAMLTTNYIEKEARKALMASIGLFVLYNLAAGMKGGVDNAAHIGGLVSGMLIGYALMPGLRNQEKKLFTAGALVALILLTIGGTFFSLRNMPDNIGKYKASMERFSARENSALRIYQLPPDATEAQVLTALDSAVYYWGENVSMIDSLRTLQLKGPLVSRNNILRSYSEWHVRYCELYIKKIREKSDQYDADIMKADTMINLDLNALNQSLKEE